MIRAGFLVMAASLLQANPLEDISASGAGRWFDLEALDRMLDGVRQRGI